MGQVIKFPGGKIQPEPEEIMDRLEEEYFRKEAEKEDCVVLAKYCFDLVEKAIKENAYTDSYSHMDFRNPATQESKDMFVITNLISALLYRSLGHEHVLGTAINDLYEQLQILLVEQALEDEDIDF